MITAYIRIYWKFVYMLAIFVRVKTKLTYKFGESDFGDFCYLEKQVTNSKDKIKIL